MRVIASTDSNQFDEMYFTMDKLYCVAKSGFFARYFRLLFAIHHQWLMTKERERAEFLKGERERQTRRERE